MVSVSVCNLVMYLLVTHITGYSSDPDTRHYQRKLKWLAFPFIFQCGWRSCYPCLYNARQTYFDTPLNGILVNRSLAAIGEVCLVAQISIVLRKILLDTHPTNHDSKWPTYVKTISYVIVFLVLGAETCSYTATATTNHLYGVFEETLWCLLISLAIPCTWYFNKRCKSFPRSDVRMIHTFNLCFAVSGVSYVSYMATQNIPKYIELWQKDQQQDKVYYDWFTGIQDAAHTRHTTREWSDWRHDFVWMSLYFSIAVWCSILLTLSPRLLTVNTSYRQGYCATPLLGRTPQGPLYA